MFLLSIYRIIKFSLQDIFRNIWLSVVTVTIIVLALFSVNTLLALNAISQAAVASVKEKVDINLYLKSDAEEEKILALKAKVSGLDQVKEVRYVSKAEALENFRAKHQSNPNVLEALRVVEKNPLTPSLVINAKNTDQYDELIVSLNRFEDPIIESRNFDNHKLIIAKISDISRKINEVGMFVSSIFVFTALLVVYNTVRVAIYTHKKEIGIMKLVGASNWFVKIPFVVSSLAYALLGSLLIIVIFYPFLELIQPYLDSFFAGYDFSVVSYFNNNFLQIFGLQFLGAAAISILASSIAVSKYSRV